MPCDGERPHMSRGSRISPLHFSAQSPFEQRLSLLCEATGLLLSQLGTAAGLSYEILPRWVAEARGGKPLPGTYTKRSQLAEYCRVPIAWLQSPEPLPPGSAAPVPGAKSGGAWAQDTLALASEAADMLTRLDGVSPAKAWALMRGAKLETPSVIAFYEMARKKLENK